ncbi:MAG: Glycerophosphoryl diester phosphodiesterase [Candidatus Carbobacillus altaicus]|uniref:Glycerophosphoryl diester phosphodiesterase n=1 Tax=Candidatus Carbonibacillus altaicus TaxID=2163959 RepID=A0A2R6Y5G1_9BACL|nr:MAG: Glycerophosphoryl diester phosphodiesterase [Candidatus Carbobacillus altaicus]
MRKERPVVVAHRGASALAPENTIIAFEWARLLGADAIEADVRLSRDRVPVILHDAYLERTTDGEGFAETKDWSDILKLDAGSWFDPSFHGARVPSLDELLLWAKPHHMPLILELKGSLIDQDVFIKAVLSVIYDHDYMHATTFSSYHDHFLYRLKQYDPKAQTALLYVYLQEPWRYALELGASALHAAYPFLRKRHIEAAHQSGLQLYVYTLSDYHDLRSACELGVDGVLTDRPELAIEACTR